MTQDARQAAVTTDYEAKARALLDTIKLNSSPAIDRGDAHGSRGQCGFILWKNHEPFVLGEILATLQSAHAAGHAKGDAAGFERGLREARNKCNSQPKLHSLACFLDLPSHPKEP